MGDRGGRRTSDLYRRGDPHPWYFDEDIDRMIERGAMKPVEPVDRVWFCAYKLPLRWEAGGDYACNPDNPRTGADCTDKCGWYLIVEAPAV